MCHKVWGVRILGDAVWAYECPPTFCTLINNLLHDYLDKFVVIYLDDIVVYSKTLEEHVEHLRIVFRTLKEHSLYVKKEKCYFAQKEIMFLGHRVGGGLIGMDEEKIRAIKEWRASTRVTELPELCDQQKPLRDHHRPATFYATYFGHRVYRQQPLSLPPCQGVAS
uniref:Reverse transcriptase domain-containing protein n=1 Tax=Ananas comosus var. bracteatus TaxID=296719 RepID=A0A6V7NXG1_ANACO|nr:unnamed protein product [Ananas comosus var. bracteatus]